MKNFKNIAVGIIALCLVILAGIALYDKWSDYKRAREAEAALAEIERNKPPRFVATIPPANGDKQDGGTDSLIVTVDDQGRIRLNADEVGTIDDLSQLRAKLAQVFKERREQHKYRPGFEKRTDIPEEERIDRTVSVKTPRELKYGMVVKVIDAVKGAGADPVGLQVAELATN
jgi:biopolymer transport protein ExbD